MQSKFSIKNDILYIIYLIGLIIFFDHRYDCFQMWDNVSQTLNFSADRLLFCISAVLILVYLLTIFN